MVELKIVVYHKYKNKSVG